MAEGYCPVCEMWGAPKEPCGDCGGRTREEPLILRCGHHHDPFATVTVIPSVGTVTIEDDLSAGPVGSV